MKNKLTIIFVSFLFIVPLLSAQQKVDLKPVKVNTNTLARIKLPDLVVSNIVVIKINNECKVELTIRNIGTAGVPAEKYGMVGDDSKASSVRVKIGAIPSTGRYLRLVDPDGKLKIPGGIVKHIWFKTDDFSTVPAGLHSITATVDDNTKIAELNENNNRMTKRLVCKMPKRPDLTIKRIYIKPPNPNKGDLIYFYAQIQNIGTAPAPASKALFKIGGETFGKTYIVPALNTGQTHEISRRLKLSIAQKYLATAIADNPDVITELNEANNKKKFGFVVN
ncbi:MAG: hypothetical protein KAS21_02620 [Candidatus Aminicenantes bacterium]|nr:hypothetical protein [Candidatus Aminicenantes bacterium]